MDELLFARLQMGLSLAFHIVFSVLGMALPVLIVLVEGRHLRTGNSEWIQLARTWSKALAVLWARPMMPIGALSSVPSALDDLSSPNPTSLVAGPA